MPIEMRSRRAPVELIVLSPCTSSTAVLSGTLLPFLRSARTASTWIRYPTRLDAAVAGIGALVDKLAPIFSSSSP
jgi:hypothetical protein